MQGPELIFNFKAKKVQIQICAHTKLTVFETIIFTSLVIPRVIVVATSLPTPIHGTLAHRLPLIAIATMLLLLMTG